MKRYVAGRYQLDLLNHESLPRAIELFDQAIALDPTFFDAYIARSDAYRQLFAYSEPPINMLQKVVDSLAEAQQLRPDSAEAWSSLGSDLCDGVALEGCLDRLEQGEAPRSDAGADGLRFCAVLLRPGRSGDRSSWRWPMPIVSIRSTRKWRIGATGRSSWWAKARRRGTGSIRRCEQHPDLGVVFSGAGVGAYIAGDYQRSVQLAEHGAESRRIARRVDHAGTGLWLCGAEGEGAAAAREGRECGNICMSL